MEAFSWWFHKYLMHGVLWKIHKTHHQAQEGWFELNDLFTFIFGGISVALLIIGISELSFIFWVGLGIAFYGGIYFVLHDVMIHKRVKWLQKPRNNYLLAIYKAHQAHHKTNQKKDAESFGLLIVSRKFFLKNKA